MWWRNNPLKNSRWLFDGNGRLRVWWKLLIAAACWFAGRLAVNTALLWMLTRLFRLWGLDASNLMLAPGWMRTLSRWSAPLCAAVTDLVTVAILTLPLRVRFEKKRAFGIGLAVSLAGTLLLSTGFLALDSLRLLEKTPRLSWDIPFLMLTGCVAALAQNLAVFGYARRELRDKTSRRAACLLCAVLYFAATGAYWLDAVGMINALLVGAVLFAVSEKWGVSCAAGLQTGFSWASAAALAYPDSAGNGLFTLYAVSEDWLTGGKSGLLSSVCVTVACLSFLGVRFLSGCVSKGKNSGFERIFRQCKAIFHRFRGAEARKINAELAEETPKLHSGN